MLEPFEKGRININELLNDEWLRKNTYHKRQRVCNLYYDDKMIIEMIKADYLSYKSSIKSFKKSKKYYFLEFNQVKSTVNKIENNLDQKESSYKLKNSKRRKFFQAHTI